MKSLIRWPRFSVVKPRRLSGIPFDFESRMESSVEGPTLCSANYAPLTPVSFLERSAQVYRESTSLVYGSLRYTWSQTHCRCLKLASALAELGISRGDVIATLGLNVPAIYELHFAVPMAGAVLCNLNVRHDSAMLSVLLQHSEAKAIFVDYRLLEAARGALNLLAAGEKNKPPIFILVSQSDDGSSPAAGVSRDMFDYEYEALVEGGHSKFEARKPKSELDPISINYTSGTTASPKGVVSSHRGAYLNALATVLLHNMGSSPVYLWTVPMFHCNGWCLTWGVAAQGGTNICLTKVAPKSIFDSIVEHKVTHMGGAPTVLNTIVNSRAEDQKPLPHAVEVMTGGSSPPQQVLAKMEKLGFNVSHLYGLTETNGPGTYCMWKTEWDHLSVDDRSKLKARQGMHHLGLEDVDVKDVVTMESVKADGKTVGEVVFRGNTVMSGYLKDREATGEAFRGGWFHSGDLAVKHPDGYIEIKDRCKDVIISGGENVSSVEVETTLYSHDAVLEAAVVARPDNHWGETPCAFVKLKDEWSASAEEMIAFCRDRLPHYMAPRTVVFGELPKTSTGKIQKYLLRERARAMGSLC